MATDAQDYGYFFETSGTDRPYTAANYNRERKEGASNGVLCRGGGLSTLLECNPSSGTMNTVVSAGVYLVEGVTAVFDSGATETHTTADATNPRIDSIIVEKDSSVGVRKAQIYILAGTPAASPVAPTLNQSSTIWQERLCNVTIPANETDADNFTYTDQRDISYSNHNVAQATETVAGIAEIADNSEAVAATNDTNMMTPLKTLAAINANTGFANDICILRRTADQTSGTVVIFDDEITDPNSMHDNSTNPERTTIVNSGRYEIIAYFLRDQKLTGGGFDIIKNTTSTGVGDFNNNLTVGAISPHSTTHVEDLIAGDYLTFEFMSAFTATYPLKYKETIADSATIDVYSQIIVRRVG